MSSHSNLFSPSPISCILPRPRLSFKSFWSLGAKDHKRPNSPLRCCPKSKAGTDQDGFQHSLPVIKWRAVVEYHTDREADHDVKERVDSIKRMLSSMNDGEISISAYDTAWVALVQDVNGSGLPQFPSTLRWIANNQLPDGSWGDDEIFLAYDRILNTLACVIALKSWNILPEKYEKGISFLNENMSKLESDNDEHMPIGFEVAFPSLLEIARRLNIEIPYDSPIFQDIYAKRNVKLERIPRDILHKLPTTLLHSLEGMPDLDWEKILKLKCQDGSFLFSPSSTAFAVMQTKDLNCLNYLKRVVRRFNGGVPCVYPVDLYEHIWTVDRLQRLGISRYFQPEIKECINYVSRYWTHKGICWARNSKVYDIDDTAMGFRLLRLHGHEVSADVFQHFEKGGEFCCFGRQSTQAVTGMFNLYRASQVLFPGEKILEDAKQFSSNFLRERQAANQLSDKWIIMKDLSGEVWYALQVPWYASLPRVETRFYLEQYGGKDDVWIGKTLYRMPFVNNKTYLELAKLDYNDCQVLHRMELDGIQKWYEDCNLGEFGLSKRALLLGYFLAAASIYEPERSRERLAWVKTIALVETIASYFDKEEMRRAFLNEFTKNINPRDYIIRSACSHATGGYNGFEFVPNNFTISWAEDTNIDAAFSHSLLDSFSHISQDATSTGVIEILREREREPTSSSIPSTISSGKTKGPSSPIIIVGVVSSFPIWEDKLVVNSFCIKRGGKGQSPTINPTTKDSSQPFDEGETRALKGGTLPPKCRCLQALSSRAFL
ncbi:hypothetical protein CIPAW_08G105500 [Carya illinoinensis]|uniref:Terpene synthase N-terminal domain-containing protein n=1 Tax=Carya illinoinensis TaxID=32201 RepID=A0A8T1PTS6_CARIL|nr:hypothetical protein CIPAW_08G105500 [Carya illinoinensis]